MIRFVFDGIREMFSGSWKYQLWIAGLAAVFLWGAFNYSHQAMEGLVVTGMSDQVSWGFYIANFAFLVGIAAAAVLLVIPAYVFHRQDIKRMVVIGEAMAVAAVVMAMMFVLVDLGRPERAWHFLPIIGRFNFPISVLAWDVLVLSGYLVLNLIIPFYVLYNHYREKEPNFMIYFPLVVVAMFWAISIHTVTAFMLSSNPARPLWHTALLGPRFISSAFASGPALIILTFVAIRRFARFDFSPNVIGTLALIMAVAMQINVFFAGVELFTDFYNEGVHGASMRYLFLGIGGLGVLQPWIWSALAMNIVALTILMINPLRTNMKFLSLACVLAFAGIWIEKGMGLVVPGFIPTTLGEVFEYTPTALEVNVGLGIWAFGILIFTLLSKAVIAIESGKMRDRRLTSVVATDPSIHRQEERSNAGLSEQLGA